MVNPRSNVAYDERETAVRLVWVCREFDTLFGAQSLGAARISKITMTSIPAQHVMQKSVEKRIVTRSVRYGTLLACGMAASAVGGSDWRGIGSKPGR